MRIHAYILAATPLWTKASVWSYYHLVDRLIVTYDRDGLGWNGKTVPVAETLERLREIDKEGKMIFRPGSFSDTSRKPFENQTAQRQAALDEASEGADWVLQLDTDEVLPDAGAFIECLHETDDGGFGGLNFPARWLYQYLGHNRFLERCNRRWRIVEGYPGPVAVRSRTQLRHARQADVPTYRVAFSVASSSHPAGAPHRAIRPDQGIIHYAWVRRDEGLQKKMENHGRLANGDHDAELANWRWCRRHKYFVVLRTPFLPSRDYRKMMRISSIPLPNQYAEADLATLACA